MPQPTSSTRSPATMRAACDQAVTPEPHPHVPKAVAHRVAAPIIVSVDPRPVAKAANEIDAGSFGSYHDRDGESCPSALDRS